LTLQEGCPVILLWNMLGGFANGTRLIVVKLMQHIIDVEIATGPDKGGRVFIPRLNITPFDAFYFSPAAVLVAARICHDYEQGPGADTADNEGVPAQACFLPRAALCDFLSVRLMAGRLDAGLGWQ
jgi:hypothetical protein